MSVHKLNHERRVSHDGGMPLGLTFGHDLYDLADAVVKTRAMRTLESVAAGYPIHRQLRCATRRKLTDVFDDLALSMDLNAVRLDEGTLLLDGADVFVQADGYRKAGYCSCVFGVWAESVERLHGVRDQLFAVVGDRYAPEQMFTLDWQFINGRGVLSSAAFDELALDTVHDEAYPTLGSTVSAFVSRFLDASETVLILQGSPGTGKTRLVRNVLGAMSARKQDSAKIMYTAEKKAMETDEIFVDFITGSHDAFVVEDADHMLLARSDGNHDLHRFLAIADGVVRAQGRKIIFTTNLPNLRDIDDALLRPGRCFATVCTRAHTRDEAARLLAVLVPDAAQQASIAESLFAGTRSVPVAEIYRAVDRAQQ